MGSALSNVLEVTVLPAVQSPVLMGALNDIGTIMTLVWTCATGSITAFTLYRRVNQGPWLLYQTLSGSTFSFIDPLDTGPIDTTQEYDYYVVAAVSAALSGPSNEVSSYAGV